MISEDILKHVSRDIFWNTYFKSHFKGKRRHAIHLAIFVEPYLTFVLDGSKTVESRFSTNKCAPYMSVNPGDAILIKKAGGPVVGVCHATYVWNYRLNRDSLAEIKRLFSTALCINDEGFWDSKKKSIYATLIKVDHVMPFDPFLIPKRDRRGWVVLSDIQQQLELQI